MPSLAFLIDGNRLDWIGYESDLDQHIFNYQEDVVKTAFQELEHRRCVNNGKRIISLRRRTVIAKLVHAFLFFSFFFFA